MSYTSALISGEYVIDESNWHAEPGINGDGSVTTGYIPRNFEENPAGSSGFAAPFNMATIPRSEWAERIKDREKRGRILTRLADAAGVKRMDQGQIGYCWSYGTVGSVHLRRLAMGLPHVQLSACSVAAPIKKFQNQGGWSGEAVRYIATNGIVPEHLWPNGNAGVNRAYYTQANLQIAKQFTIDAQGWIDLQQNNFDQLMTLLLLDLPAPVGLDWWGHLICAVDPLILGANSFGYRFDNSWGRSYGTDGRGVLAESKGRPTECVAPITIRPSLYVPGQGSSVQAV